MWTRRSGDCSTGRRRRARPNVLVCSSVSLKSRVSNQSMQIARPHHGFHHYMFVCLDLPLLLVTDTEPPCNRAPFACIGKIFCLFRRCAGCFFDRPDRNDKKERRRRRRRDDEEKKKQRQRPAVLVKITDVRRQDESYYGQRITTDIVC